MNRQWLSGGKPGPDTQVRLFCFPFAGGSAGAYHRWPTLAPSGVHVSGVEYPGRGMRLVEEPYVNLLPLVRSLADRIEPYLQKPYAFFGHSMGGLVAYELTRTLRVRALPGPRHLFLSATSAPATPSVLRSLAETTDAEVREELRNLGGTRPELLDDPELMEIAVRALRADSMVLATYEHRAAAPLDVPLTVFGGRSDLMVPPAHLRGWPTHTTAGCRFKLFPGGHFFLESAAEEILRTVALTVTSPGPPLVPVD